MATSNSVNISILDDNGISNYSRRISAANVLTNRKVLIWPFQFANQRAHLISAAHQTSNEQEPRNTSPM